MTKEKLFPSFEEKDPNHNPFAIDNEPFEEKGPNHNPFAIDNERFKEKFANFKEESAQIIQPDDTQDRDLQQVLEADGRDDLGLDKPKFF